MGVEKCHFLETKAKVKDIEISREISFYQFSRSPINVETYLTLKCNYV